MSKQIDYLIGYLSNIFAREVLCQRSRSKCQGKYVKDVYYCPMKMNDIVIKHHPVGWFCWRATHRVSLWVDIFLEEKVKFSAYL